MQQQLQQQKNDNFTKTKRGERQEPEGNEIRENNGGDINVLEKGTNDKKEKQREKVQGGNQQIGEDIKIIDGESVAASIEATATSNSKETKDECSSSSRREISNTATKHEITRAVALCSQSEQS